MSKLIELAERCEAVACSSKSLDLEIHKALGLKDNCEYYTASLDAAMTLVPGGVDRQLAYWPSQTIARAWLVGGTEQYEGRAESEALALCAAALRARASQEAK